MMYAIGVLAVGLAASTSARAADAKAYAGMACETSAGGNDSGMRYNASGSTATFVCPIVRDSTAAALNLANTYVWARDTSGTDLVFCQLYTDYFAAFSAQWAADVASSQYPVGVNPVTRNTQEPVKLTFVGSSVNRPSSLPTWDHLVCTVPGGNGTWTSSSIVSYFVDEL